MKLQPTATTGQKPGGLHLPGRGLWLSGVCQEHQATRAGQQSRQHLQGASKKTQLVLINK